MQAGDLYRPDDPELAAASRRAKALIDRYNRAGSDQDEHRRELLVELFGSIGPGCELIAPIFCDYGSQLHLGARVFANVGLVALDVATIAIGDDAKIGPGVQLLTPTHPLDPALRRTGWEAAEPITIGENVWLGGGVIVLPGVTIGPDAVVGAGSVVTRDLPAGAVAMGNPARVVRTVPSDRG